MKTCDSCGEKHRSEEWSLSVELAKSNKRMFVALLVVIALWFATIFGFIWYINSYEYEVVDVYSMDGGYANYVGNDGDINNGTYYGSQTNEEKR